MAKQPSNRRRSTAKKSDSKTGSDKPSPPEQPSIDETASDDSRDPSAGDADNQAPSMDDDEAPDVILEAGEDGVETLPAGDAGDEPDPPPSDGPGKDPSDTPSDGPDHIVKPPAKRRRLGSDHQPRCPRCSTKNKDVLCVARSSRELITYYYCPNDDCDFSVKVARPDIAQHIGRKRHNRGFSAR